MKLSLPLVSILALLVAVAVPACRSQPKVPVVASTGNLVREPDPPAVSTGAVVKKLALLDSNRVLARVNDQIITVRSVQAKTGAAWSKLQTATEDQLRGILDRYTRQILSDRLFIEAAKRLGVKVTQKDLEAARKRDEEEARRRGTTLDEDNAMRHMTMWEREEKWRRSVLISKYVGMSLGAEQPISREARAVFDIYVGPREVRSWYDRHQDDYRQTASARAPAIWVKRSRFGGDDAKTLAFTKSVVKRARAGEDFSKIVKEVDGKQAPDAFQELLTPDSPILAAARQFVWSAPVGSVSDPIPLRSGYLVVKLMSRRKACVRPFDEVRHQILRRLENLKFQIGVLKIQLDLLDAAAVTPRRFRIEIRKRLRWEIHGAQTELAG